MVRASRPALLVAFPAALLVLLPAPLGCRRAVPPAPQLEPMTEVPDAPLVPPSGQIVGDAYVDVRLPLRVVIPPGWTPRLGRDADPRRLTLEEPRAQAGLLVGISAAPGSDLTPLPHPACEWTFTDVGRFALGGRSGPVGIATCTPGEASSARILDWAFVEGGYTWHIEVHAPNGRLGDAAAAADLVLAGMTVPGAAEAPEPGGAPIDLRAE